MNQDQPQLPFDNLNNQKFMNILDQIDTDPKVKEEIFLFLIVTVGNIFRIFKNIKNISHLNFQQNNQEINKNFEEINQSIKNLIENSSISLSKYLTINLKKQARNFIDNNKELFQEIDKKYNKE
tara:strand:- start:287 stop:658 length:372 start_codon:yes stop_codon:yes gene_type:complete